MSVTSYNANEFVDYFVFRLRTFSILFQKNLLIKSYYKTSTCTTHLHITDLQTTSIIHCLRPASNTCMLPVSITSNILVRTCKIGKVQLLHCIPSKNFLRFISSKILMIKSNLPNGTYMTHRRHNWNVNVHHRTRPPSSYSSITPENFLKSLSNISRNRNRS